MPINWEHRFEQLGHLPESSLFDIARNGSAPREFRLFAVELMLDKGYAKANHEELAGLVAEVKGGWAEPESQLPLSFAEETPEASREEIVAHFQEHVASLNSGPFQASVTTATMSGDEVVHFPDERTEVVTEQPASEA